MHELGITESILNQAVAEAKKQRATRISRIKLLVGEGVSVVPECMQFYFETMRKGTLAAEAVLEIETIPLRLRCAGCQTEVKDMTPTCGCSAGVEFVSGQELMIDYIEIDPSPNEMLDTPGSRSKI